MRVGTICVDSPKIGRGGSGAKKILLDRKSAKQFFLNDFVRTVFASPFRDQAEHFEAIGVTAA